MDKTSIINRIIKVEQGYVNNLSDRGGPTNWGITERVARKNGYAGEMRDLPRATAESIYANEYITLPGFDRVYEISPIIGFELIDTGVNMGQMTAGIFLQRALNAVQSGSKLFVDGRVGEKTCEGLSAYLRARGVIGTSNLLKAMNALQGVRYIEIVENDASQQTNINGWLAKRIEFAA